MVYLTLPLPALRWAGHNTDLPSDSNISKPFNGNLSKVMKVDRLCSCGSQVIDV